MCGFIASVNDPEIDIEHSLLKIHHRGPDSRSIISDLNWVFGFNRLSIVGDLNYNQPYKKSGSRAILCFNGEIYNYNELAAKYLEKKTKFLSDTEVLYYLLLKYGASILEKLDGIFAIVFFNPEANQVIIARDEFGVKPLFWGRKNRKVYICSELTPIHDLISTSFETNGLFEHLTFGHSLEGRTIYNDIYEFSSGEYRVYDLDFNEKQRNKIYAHTDYLKNNTVEELVERTLTLQKPDIDYSILFSGGIDSTIITKYLGHDDRCREILSINVDHSDMSELDWQIEGLKRFNLLPKHHCLNQTSLQFDVGNLEECVKRLDQPITHPNYIGALAISEVAKKSGVKVLISGEGADELFAGYKWFLNNSETNLDILSYLDRSSMANYFGVNLSKYDFVDTLEKDVFFKTKYLPKWLLRADLTGMFHSIEVRVPFLGRLLSNWSEATEFDQKTDQGKTTKLPLKMLLREDLGEKYIYRKKVGFDYPLNDWINQSHIDELGKLDFLDTKDIKNLTEGRHSDFKKSRCIFVLTSFAIWSQRSRYEV